eukprot:Amastigsp_a509544_41.p2 type:complete len:150 gc:universal Amastigsp_a509544_41:30-479(+)
MDPKIQILNPNDWQVSAQAELDAHYLVNPVEARGASVAVQHLSVELKWRDIRIVQIPTLKRVVIQGKKRFTESATPEANAKIYSVLVFSAHELISVQLLAELFSHLVDPNTGEPADEFTMLILDTDSSCAMYRIYRGMVHPLETETIKL